MKHLTAVIERNKDAFFAYIKEVDGCVAGGKTYHQVKLNLEKMLKLAEKEDDLLKKTLSKGYKLKFEVNLESVFDLIPEVNISQLAKTANLNPGLLRQYVSGSKKASEAQTEKVMKAIKEVCSKLNSITLSIN
ncbi:MAG: type II toxin-antitoxin system HicB family antitoxin [Saprospiraceae bacterium]